MLLAASGSYCYNNMSYVNSNDSSLAERRSNPRNVIESGATGVIDERSKLKPWSRHDSGNILWYSMTSACLASGHQMMSSVGHDRALPHCNIRASYTSREALGTHLGAVGAELDEGDDARGGGRCHGAVVGGERKRVPLRAPGLAEGRGVQRGHGRPAGLGSEV